MTIRKIANAGTSNCVVLPRRAWLAVLKQAKPTDPADTQMVADLRKGSESIGVDEVLCERLQVLRVCDLAGIDMPSQPTPPSGEQTESTESP